MVPCPVFAATPTTPPRPGQDSELRDAALIANRVPTDGIVAAGLDAELSKIRAAKEVGP